MSGEFLVVNPRRKRSRGASRPRGAGGRFLKVNPRRKRRHGRIHTRRSSVRYLNPANPARMSRRRYVRNPAVLGLDLGSVLTVAGGALGANIAANFAKGLYAPLASGLPRVAFKAALAVVLSKFGRMVLPRNVAHGLAVGAGASAVLDGYHMMVPSGSTLGNTTTLPMPIALNTLPRRVDLRPGVRTLPAGAMGSRRMVSM